ncbi:bZIP transcription factor 16 [Nymphaea thermarum]|nr:bZIP transcription factor 16 [Nymphaea thermarum]
MCVCVRLEEAGARAEHCVSSTASARINSEARSHAGVMKGGGGMDASTKAPKTSSGQEQPSTSSSASAYTDCASFQAYFNPSGTSPIPPAGFFHSPMGSSPQAHPYIWGAQQMVPPYGTPPPYVAMYSHGLYGHPSIAQGSHPYSTYMMPFSNGTAESSAGGGPELEGKQRSPIKSAKGGLGNLNTLTGKDNDAKASGALANGTPSQSCESGDEDPSTEGSDANSENDSQRAPTRKQESLSAEEARNENTACSPQCSVTQAQSSQNDAVPAMAIPPVAITGPATSLNIGMDYWNGPASAPAAAIQSKVPPPTSSAPILPAPSMGPHDGVPSEMWLQAECEELARRVETLKDENGSLRSELRQLREECEKLKSENDHLTERLQKMAGNIVSENGHDQSECNSQAANAYRLEMGLERRR